MLAEGGYAQGDPATFDKKLGLDVGTWLGFLKESQPKEWGRYAKMAGAGAEREIVARFCRAVHTEGLLRVLRQGFMDRGVRFRAVFWKPETSINETGRRQYESNVFHCTRQLHYSPNNGNSIDMVLFVNGIPVVSLELKCQFTGQNAGNAIAQYRFDRAGKETLFTHNERVLVHFAVDFRSTLGRFNRIYAFITQVCRLFDKELHRFSVYARFLSMQLPAYHGEAVDADDKVLLEFYRLEKDFEGGIALESTGEGMRPITGDAGHAPRKTDPLSKLIAEINARFGTDFTEMDKVLLQMEEECARDEKWKACAQNNDMATFAALFHRDFPAIAVNRYKMNDAFFVKIFQEPEMLAMVEKTLASVLYQRLVDLGHSAQVEEFGMLEAAESEVPY